MMNFKMVAILASVLAGLVLVSIVGFRIYRLFNYTTETTLAESFLITDQWQEIEVKTILQPLSQDRNSIYITAPASFKAFQVDQGIVAPDGTVIEPEVEAIDSTGEIHLFNQTGAVRQRNYEMASYKPYAELKKGLQIDRIRIRANQQLRVPVILWSSYDIKDLP